METLAASVSRSQEFHEHLLGLLARVDAWDDSRRPAACALSCETSLEHARAVGVLVATELGQSAVVALRAQYEAVVRAAWLLYSASEADVNRLLQPLNPTTEQEAKNIATPLAMLEALAKAEAKDPGLRGLVRPLTEAHAVLWRGMTSFAHIGLHALHRQDKGFPAQLAIDLMRNSNLFALFAARLLVRTGVPAQLHHEIDRAFESFEDCLPTIRAVPPTS